MLPVWNEAAAEAPFIVLVDLDDRACPVTMVQNWLKGHSRHPNLILRVAVREVEAWLLADRQNLADFLHVPIAKLPKHPESLADPKAAIVQAAHESAVEDVRVGITPIVGSSVPHGRYYNPMMRSFARDTWDIAKAAKQSESLKRAFKALKGFSQT